MKTIVWNDQQEDAFRAISVWLQEERGEPLFVLRGYAGTGKTSLMRRLCTEFSATHSFALCAPTNKAVKVLARTVADMELPPECRTIYSLLGIQMRGTESDVPTLVFPNVIPNLSGFDAIILDEASMLSSELLDYILSVYPFVRFLFLGDPAQLPPVGEDESPVWGLTCEHELTKIERHDNQILVLATAIRDALFDDQELAPIGPHNDQKEGIFRLKRAKFNSSIIVRAEKQLFLKQDSIKVIAWRNKTVNRYNHMIRQAMFGEPAAENPYLVGDVLLLAEPVLSRDGQHSIATIDDEGAVVKVHVDAHPDYPSFQCYHILLDGDGVRGLLVYVLHGDDQLRYSEQLGALATTARQLSDAKRGLEARKAWFEFWRLRNSFHKVRYSYAITAHRAQGSTFNTVFVDHQDILANPDRDTAYRCLYVAVTRAKKRVIVG